LTIPSAKEWKPTCIARGAFKTWSDCDSMSSALKLLNSATPRFTRTQALDALGEGAFAAFSAVRAPGRVIWCNFDLARELGFDVPRSNQLTPQLEEELLAKLSLRAVMPGEVAGADVVTMYADKYGGEGISPALGAGRAGFLREGNLYVKGVGFTPLFAHNDKDDFAHSHGGVQLDDCLSEAVFGEVNQNLFALGSSRIVAIIDQGKFVTDPAGRRYHIALAVRAGGQLRPGHLLAKRARGSLSPLEMFVQIVTATNQLVTNSSGLPDLSATMLRIIDDHARTAAQSFRWRMIHGALSPSNMDVSGAMLDLPTQSTQPRTAPIFLLDYAWSAFGTEHRERATHLATMYRRVLRATDSTTRARFNLKSINVAEGMDRSYAKHLQLSVLAATGIKPSIAQRLQLEHADIPKRFTDLLLAMADLKNPGSTCVARRVVEDISVVDVFGLLRKLPRDFFNQANLRASTLKRARPVYKGNRFHIRARKRRLADLANEFATVYTDLMQAAEPFYESRAAMETSITARAAFENQQIDALYCYPLYEQLRRAIAAYQQTGNAQLISEAIDTRITRSLRSVDGLLAQGSSRRLRNGGMEIEMRTIRGVSYSVRAWNGNSQARKLHVSIPITAAGKQFLTGVPGLEELTKRQIETLRYRFAIAGGKTFHVATARLLYHRHLGALIDFGDLDTSVVVGRLEGYFSADTLRTRVFRDYVFALPDRDELCGLLASIQASRRTN
jgi:hypothetical protein